MSSGLIKHEKEKELLVVILPEKGKEKFPMPKIVNSKNEKNIKTEQLENDQNKKSEKFVKTCRICNRGFKTKGRYYNHMEEHRNRSKMPKKPIEPPKIFTCDIDGKIFSKKPYLYTHMQIHLPKKSIPQKVKCEICHKKLQPCSLKDHLKIVHGERTFQCDSCEKSFKANWNLQKHIRTHVKPLECKICGKKFALKKSLKEHEPSHMPKELKTFSCKTCGLKFQNLTHFTRHQRRHNMNLQKLIQCTKCNFATNCQKSYKIHQKSHKLKEERAAKIKNPLRCDKCPAVLRNRQALKCHMTNCHPCAPYECDLCGRVINAKSNVTKHMKFHLSMRSLED